MPVRFATGIDVIEIERIESAIERWGERFLKRVYTDTEILHCRGRAQSLAGRFAAKEAASKALGTGIRSLSWKEIEVVRGPSGKPIMALHGKARHIADELGLTNFEVSITHSRTDAIVVVVAWGEIQ